MADRSFWVGLDTSTRTFGVCIKDEVGAVVAATETEANRASFDAFISDYRNEIRAVCLEICATSVAIARELRERGMNVVMYNPRHVHNFLRLRRNKTDRNDASGLADVARLGASSLRQAHLKSRESQRIRTHLVVRETLIKQRKANEALLMNIFHLHGVRAGARVFSAKSLVEIVGSMVQALPKPIRNDVKCQINPLLRTSLAQRAETKKIDAFLRGFATGNPVWRRLSTLPGIGVISGLSFMTAIDDPWRFRTSSDVGPYLGLTPKVWETGKYTRKFGISKAGSKLTRKHLNIAAQAALRARQPNEFQVWAKQLTERVGRKKAIVALSRKLAVVMLAMWRNGDTYERREPVSRKAHEQASDSETDRRVVP